VGIVFGVARSEPRSNSASAGAKPGGIEAPEIIPSSSGVAPERSSAKMDGEFKNSLFFAAEFHNPKNFRLSRGQIKTPRFTHRAVISFSEREKVVLIFWLKFLKLFTNHFSNLVGVPINRN